MSEKQACSECSAPLKFSKKCDSCGLLSCERCGAQRYIKTSKRQSLRRRSNPSNWLCPSCYKKHRSKTRSKQGMAGRKNQRPRSRMNRNDPGRQTAYHPRQQRYRSNMAPTRNYNPPRYSNPPRTRVGGRDGYTGGIRGSYNYGGGGRYGREYSRTPFENEEKEIVEYENEREGTVENFGEDEENEQNFVLAPDILGKIGSYERAQELLDFAGSPEQ